MNAKKQRRSAKALVDALAFLFLALVVITALCWVFITWTVGAIVVGLSGALVASWSWLANRQGAWFK